MKTAPEQRVERARRQVLHWQLKDTGIDGTSPIGLYAIEHYRPEYRTMHEFDEIHRPEAIQEWIDL